MSKPQTDPGKIAKTFIQKLKKDGGKFVRMDGKIFVLLKGKRIEINPAFENHAYAELQIRYCDKATAEYTGRAVCQRVLVLASSLANSIRVAKVCTQIVSDLPCCRFLRPGRVARASRIGSGRLERVLRIAHRLASCRGTASLNLPVCAHPCR